MTTTKERLADFDASREEADRWAAKQSDPEIRRLVSAITDRKETT